MKYEIVCFVGKDAYAKTVKEVQRLIDSGWYPQGGVSIIPDYSNHTVGCAQAVVKNDGK